MMRYAVALLLAFAVFARADNLLLRDGTSVSGTWLGGDNARISFMVDNQVRTFSRSDVARVTFGSQPPPTSADPKQPVAIGQTVDQVEAALGKPSGQFLIKGKKIYVYQDPAVKITFEDGKVSDIK